MRWTGPPPATEPVDVIVPVLHRPQNVQPLLESLHASTGLAIAWFVCEEGDKIQAATVEAHGGGVMFCSGTFAHKVNHAYRNTTAPWLMLVGDDVIFRPGWLDAAQARSAKGYAVIGTNDLGNPRVLRGEHATHILIDRSYVDEMGGSWDGPGIVCHEGYGHCFVDDEIVTAAKQRGVWVSAADSIVEHLHPLWGKAPDDDVYRKGQAALAADRATFESRFLVNAGT